MTLPNYFKISLLETEYHELNQIIFFFNIHFNEICYLPLILYQAGKKMNILKVYLPLILFQVKI